MFFFVKFILNWATDLKKVVWNFDKELLIENSLENGTRMTRIG
jgi:hypothetical protein